MKFIIATGGSGGHIFPAAIVAEDLIKQGHDVVLIGVFKRYKDYLSRRKLKFIEHEAAGVVGTGPFRFISSLGLMYKAVMRCRKLLKTERPDAVAGFGGYGAFPVVLAAVLDKVPTVIHEQNVVPGRANRLLGLFVNKVAISFKKTSEHWKNNKQVLTGCPCHVKIIESDRSGIYRRFGLDEKKKTLLILGGSQGSERINNVFAQTVDKLDYAEQLQAILISGYTKFDDMKARFRTSPVPVQVHDFLNDVHEAITIADIVVARAGAMTVTELAGYNKSAILVPYPYAGGHQMKNARLLQESGHARIIDDTHFTPLYLSQVIKEVLESGTDHEDDDEPGIYIPDAAQKISKLILSAVT